MNDKIVRTTDGFNWLVREQGYDTDYEPLRNYEVTVYDVLKEIGEKTREENDVCQDEYKETVFIDIGANSGAHAVRLANVYDQVIAIEPDPGNLIVLKKNVEVNNLQNVDIIEVGASNVVGYVNFLAGAAQAMVTDAGNISIKVDILDNIIRKLEAESNLNNVTAIKIDVEGHEEKVLFGAKYVIEKYRPAFIVEHHEYRGDLAQECAGMKERIRDYLGKLGYIGINIDFVHWLYVFGENMKYNLDMYQEAIFAHWFNFVIDNLKSGREWYHGVPGTWWHGMGIIDFYKELPRHISDGDQDLINIKV